MNWLLWLSCSLGSAFEILWFCFVRTYSELEYLFSKSFNKSNVVNFPRYDFIGAALLKSVTYQLKRKNRRTKRRLGPRNRPVTRPWRKLPMCLWCSEGSLQWMPRTNPRRKAHPKLPRPRVEVVHISFCNIQFFCWPSPLPGGWPAYIECLYTTIFVPHFFIRFRYFFPCIPSQSLVNSKTYPDYGSEVRIHSCLVYLPARVQSTFYCMLHVYWATERRMPYRVQYVFELKPIFSFRRNEAKKPIQKHWLLAAYS